MKIDFWDVGQGDCTVITRPDGQLILIDVGPKNNPLIGWLRDHPEKRISDVVLTHNHADHIGAVAPLLEVCAGRIKKVWLLQDANRSAKQQQSVINMLSPLRRAANEWDLEVATIRRGITIWEDSSVGVSLYTLYPSDLDAVLEISSDPNLGSAILSLTHTWGGSLIWPGDNTVGRTAEVKPETKTALLMGPHHGAPSDSKRPNRKLFHDPLESVRPERVFISVGTDNTYSHPSPRYINRLQELGARVCCSGLTRWCDRRIRDRAEGDHVLNGAARLGLRRTKKGFACRGSLRLHVDHEGFYEDENSEDHRKAVQQLTHPFCMQRDTWRRK